ncbi:MAG: GNAT family N-acetyltransferase [Verrucomicrobiota bacterium]
MKIRRATIADVPVLVLLNRSVHALHVDALPDRFRRDPPTEVVSQAFTTTLAAPSSYWLLAEEQNEIAGFLSAGFLERDESWYSLARHVCYLAGIAVAPHFRHRGIARALVADLQREAAARGASSIELDVWAINTSASEVFSKLGFNDVMRKMTLPMVKSTAVSPGI